MICQQTDPWGQKQNGARTDGAGFKYLQEWVEIDSNCAGIGEDGTEILSLCRPLMHIPQWAELMRLH